MCEQHLDPFAIAARLVEGGRVIESPGHVSGLFVDVARDLAQRCVGAQGDDPNGSGSGAIAMAPESLPIVLAKIREFVMPPTTVVAKGATFEETWPPGGPWRAR